MWFLINLTISGLITIIIACIFCFWFCSLASGNSTKEEIYISALEMVEHGECGSQEQMVVYNAETELVKNLFLFFMNIVEWLAFLLNIIVYWYELYQSHINCSILSKENIQYTIMVILKFHVSLQQPK